jgi:sulfoxide reductase heme-binding subunit YedZ
MATGIRWRRCTRAWISASGTSVSVVGRVLRPGVRARAFAKTVLFLAALVPAGLLVRGILTSDLGINPAETIQLETGRWTFKFLLLTLAVTPVRRITGWNGAIQYRRMLGLFAFFYGTLHFASYWSFDLVFAFGRMFADVVKRPFITMGFAAYLLMLPLALTSTKGWIRRLGRKWGLLHRLIYVSAICAAIHFAWKQKVFAGDPVYYAVVVSALLGFRLAWAARQRLREARTRRVNTAAF